MTLPYAIDKTIIEFLVDGLVYKEVGARVGMKTRAVQNRITELKSLNNCRTTTELCCRYVNEDKNKLIARFRNEILPILNKQPTVY